MSAPAWESGHAYPTGSVVQPKTTQPALFESLVNGDFEAGNLTGWDVTQTGAGTASASSGRPYSGTYAGRWTGAYGGTGPNGGTFVVLLNTAKCAVVPGQQVMAKAIIAQDDTSDSANYGAVRLYWYTAADTLIKYDEATKIVAGNYSYYENNSLTASAPSGAAYARMGVWLNANGEGGMWVDNCGWSTNSPPTTIGLVYTAVQPAPGVSGSTEPTWPTTNGVQVVDNTVTWEAITGSLVEWVASPILKSGSTEPTWPTTVGASVPDNTISWECISRRVEDAKCPQSKVVAIIASKVFAADKDIVRFSATANPMDWTSAEDAGYLPTGLQQSNAGDLAVLQPYRGNLCAWNASSFQMWQVDPDPAAMALLDQMDSIGSTWQLAAQAVGNDLYYLSQLGVRSVNIANAAENMQAGDVGTPIDVLIMERLTTPSLIPLSTYYPGAGQYWLAFQDPLPPQITLWGKRAGSGGIYIDATELFNTGIAGASVVTLTGWYSPQYVFTYPPAEYPLPVDLSGMTLNEVNVPMTVYGGGSSGILKGDLPLGMQINEAQWLVVVNVDGVSHYAAVTISPGW